MGKKVLILGLVVGKYGYGELSRGQEYLLHSVLSECFGYTKPVGDLGEYLLITNDKGMAHVAQINDIIAEPPMEDSLNIDYNKAIAELMSKGWEVYEVSNTTCIELGEYSVKRILLLEEPECID